LTDANAQIANQYDYDSYGQRLTVVESVPQPFAWKGREWIPGPSLYFSRARYYDPQLGRFTSEDSIGYGGGDWNFYSFAWNNPRRWADPTGNDVGVEYAGIATNAVLTGAATGAAGAGVACAFNQIGAALEAALEPGTVVAIEPGLCSASAVIRGAAIGAITAPFAAVATAKVLNSLSPPIKQAIGEQLSYMWNTLGGATIAKQSGGAIGGGLTTIPDWIFFDGRGILYYVESKFGLSSLTDPQKAALAALGPVTYRVERWGYEFFSGIGAGVDGFGTGYFNTN